MRVHAEATVAERRKRGRQVVRSLNPGVPISHRQEQDVGPVAVRRGPSACRIQLRGWVVPALLEFTWTIACAQVEVNPLEVVRSNELFKLVEWWARHSVFSTAWSNGSTVGRPATCRG